MMSDFSAFDAKLDTLVNIDVGNRGIAPLFEANRALIGSSPVGAAADLLLTLPVGGTVILTTGSVTRAWITPDFGENDGPSGAAAIIRALALGRRATTVVVGEPPLLRQFARVFTAAGLTVVDLEQARRASADGSLATVVLQPFPDEDKAGVEEAERLLDELKPGLLFSTERVGRNRNGVYYNMGGRDYSFGRARVDRLFDAAMSRGIPTICVGDGGNEIGMGNLAEEVEAHIPNGANGSCPCGGGIGAVSRADVLVTAAVSNWACTAITAAMAAREGNPSLFHGPEAEAFLLDVMVREGLITGTKGIVDANVDGIARDTHIAISQICRSLLDKAL